MRNRKDGDMTLKPNENDVVRKIMYRQLPNVGIGYATNQSACCRETL